MGCSKGDSLLFHRILRTIYKVYLPLKKDINDKHQLNSMVNRKKVERPTQFRCGLSSSIVNKAMI